MLSKTILAVLATCLVAASGQKLDKPTIRPPLVWHHMEAAFRKNLNPTHSIRVRWPPGWIPEACKEYAHDNSLNPTDFTITTVRYDDCNEPWVFCRHKHAPASESDMIDIFGRMPVHMRSYVRQFIAVPDRSDGVVGLWMYPGDIMIANRPVVHVLAHEMSHGLDYMDLESYDSPFSDTDAWRNSYHRDSAVPSDYSRTNFAEDFAEAGIVGVYDKVVPGGIASIEPNWQAIKHQYTTYQKFVGDSILPGGRCNVRVTNSATVRMDDAAGGIRGVETKPFVGFTDPNITTVKINTSFMGRTFVHGQDH